MDDFTKRKKNNYLSFKILFLYNLFYNAVYKLINLLNI